MKRYIGSISDDPTIVARSNIKEISSPHNINAPIVHGAGCLARYYHTNVLDLTAEGADHMRHMNRPLPTGFIGGAANCHPTNFDQLEASLFEDPHFIRGIESLDQQVIVCRKHKCRFLAEPWLCRTAESNQSEWTPRGLFGVLYALERAPSSCRQYALKPKLRTLLIRA